MPSKFEYTTYYAENKGGGSYKFWQAKVLIDLPPSELTWKNAMTTAATLQVTYGKIGNLGQVKNYEFRNIEDAVEVQKKKSQDKERHGYVKRDPKSWDVGFDVGFDDSDELVDDRDRVSNYILGAMANAAQTVLDAPKPTVPVANHLSGGRRRLILDETVGGEK